VLSPHALGAAARQTLRAAPPWDWRRRVALAVEVRLPGLRLDVVDVHLSPHDGAARHRAREAGRVVAGLRRRRPLALIAGDLNEVPGGEGVGVLLAAGWSDAWVLRHGDELGATSWRTGSPRRDRADQRIDYVLAPPGAVVADAAVALEPPLELSDHLPVVATVECAGWTAPAS
jgi:endonuclease/exonuclease/phosphatase family metal-dependent hydrolase